MSDAIEALGWLIYFWLFIFSKKFRTAWIQEYKVASSFEKVFKSWEALVSIIFGMAPFAALFYLLKG